MKILHVAHAALVSLAVLIAVSDLSMAVNDRAVFKFKCKRDDDKLSCVVEGDKSIISIRSPFGISNAVIERLQDDWPAKIILQLHLQGLEQFSVTEARSTAS